MTPWIALPLLSGALAADYDASGFVLEDVNGVKWDISRYEIPDFGPEDLPVAGEDAWCELKVRVRQSGNEVQPVSCPAALMERSMSAVQDWTGTWSGEPGFLGIFHISFLLEATADGGAQPWLIVDHDQSEGLIGQAPPGVRRWDALEVKRRKAPHFPRAAQAKGLREASCQAIVAVDVDGRPTSVEVSGCDEVFYAPTVKALMRWRFDPLRVDGVPQPGVMATAVDYRAY